MKKSIKVVWLYFGKGNIFDDGLAKLAKDEHEAVNFITGSSAIEDYLDASNIPSMWAEEPLVNGEANYEVYVMAMLPVPSKMYYDINCEEKVTNYLNTKFPKATTTWFNRSDLIKAIIKHKLNREEIGKTTCLILASNKSSVYRSAVTSAMDNLDVAVISSSIINDDSVKKMIGISDSVIVDDKTTVKYAPIIEQAAKELGKPIFYLEDIIPL